MTEIRDREDGSSTSSIGKASSWMTSFAGIVTAFAAIATSTSAVLGLLVHRQSVQLQQARTTVSHQAQQIHQLSQSVARRPAAVASTAPAPSNTSGAAATINVAHYLSDLNPTVDNSIVNTGQQVIKAIPYPKSIVFSCNGGNGNQPDEAYDVAGSTQFTAVVGIPDNTQDVTGVIATVTFSNEAGQQVGKTVQVSLGHPVTVKLNISGVTQLGLTCNGRDARTSQATSGFDIALGNAGVS